ncbi:hypothetical protein [Micromonospora cremea]|uniref:hypothetical protein n=1 Tax=Micromonospora cremea TaxID=709881 RepID=UPI001FCBB072|nr:hypothetical protein [Micromonospora cremea]
MKPPSKLCTTRYRPLTTGTLCIGPVAGLLVAGPPVRPAVDGRDPADALGDSPLARGDSPGRNGGADDPGGVGVETVGGTGPCGSDSAGGSADASSDAGLHPRYAPSAMKSRTTITTTPANTTIQGDDATAAGPRDRRMPDMNLPQPAVRAA